MNNLEQALNNCKIQGSKLAIKDVSKDYTYADLNTACNHIIQLLDDANVPKGSYVGIYCESKPLSIVSILALFQYGCGYIPLDPIYPDDRLNYMVRNANANFIIADTTIGFTDPSTKIINVDAKAFSSRTANQSTDKTSISIRDEQPGYIIYTSGSTGHPKGVVMCCGVLDRLIQWQNKRYSSNHHTSTLQFSAFSFDVSFQEIFSTLSIGGSLITISNELKQDFKALAEFIVEENIDRLFMPYVALKNIAEWFTRLELYPSQLREVITAGEQLLVSNDIRTLFSALPSTTLSNQYGPSETHVVSEFLLEGDAQQWPEVPPIGLAIDHAKLYVLNEDMSQTVNGETGELYIAGSVLSDGYYNNQEETNKRFIEININGNAVKVYRTGDLVYKDDSNCFHYSGRIDSQVKISGYRIELSEIETTLLQQADISNAAVSVFEHQGQKQLIAFIVGDQSKLKDIKQSTALKLPNYMQPAKFQFLDALRVTPSGKIDRRTMVSEFQSQQNEHLHESNHPAKAVQNKSGKASKQDLIDLVSEVLGHTELNLDSSLVDNSMSSLLANQLSVRLYEQFGYDIPAYKLFQYKSINLFADKVCLTNTKLSQQPGRNAASSQSHDIAIIGMAVNVPGANNLTQYWDNLRNGVESLHIFNATTESGEVNTRGIIESPTSLDAKFFGISPIEAEFIDPQQRILLELAWHALEDSNIVADDFPGRIGVYCGTGNNSYYLENILQNREKLEEYGALQAMVANEKDYTATRISHKLNLNGPAVNIQTACSTSLVCVCQAVAALRAGECEMALAGAASVTFPQAQPHIPEEGSIKSHDGHTRPFDANANGTVFSDGAAMVVLKRVDYAIEDNDEIYAVIKGVALNNDGSEKGSFSAPSEEGQKQVILGAQIDASIKSSQIGYIEAHGTATPIGDPIEVSALKQAFAENAEARDDKCLLGSVKSNFGHLTAAAGVAGLIKSALAVKYGEIPPSINFSHANPALSLEQSPFSVCSKTSSWDKPATERIAGVSSFGIGGTNAHVVISGYEETMAEMKVVTEQQELNLPICISAKSEKSVDLYRQSLLDYLNTHKEVDFDALKRTLCLNRSSLPIRLSIVARNAKDAIEQLAAKDLAINPFKNENIVLLLPGQGTQVHGMGKELYEHVPLFKQYMDKCIVICQDSHGLDLKDIVFTVNPNLHKTQYTQIALFSLGYALGKSLIDLGVRVDGIIGHSIGELAAATLSGVFDLHTAIKVVLTRGRVMQKQVPGSILAVDGRFGEVSHLLSQEVVLSAENTPDAFTLSGEDKLIDTTREALKEAGIRCTKLKTSHAFHSPMMIPAEREFIDALQDITMTPPKIPFISCVSGNWITKEDATDIKYWASQIVAPVQFCMGARQFSSWKNLLAIDCGPKSVASHLFEECLVDKDDLESVSLLSKPANENEPTQLRTAIGNIWECGVNIDWQKLCSGNKVSKTLPLYQFDHKEFYIEASPLALYSTNSIPGSLPELNHVKLSQNITTLKQALLQDFSQLVSNIETPHTTQLASTEANTTACVNQIDKHLSATPNESNTSFKTENGNMTQDATAQLKALFSDTSGIDLSDANPDATFFELGLDSLFLTQLALKLKKTYRSKVSFRQLMNEFSSFNKLAEKLISDGALFNAVSTPAPSSEPAQGTAITSAHLQMQVQNPVVPASVSVTNNSANSPLNALLAQQLNLVNGQISLLQQLSQSASIAPQHVEQTASSNASDALSGSSQNTQGKKPFGAGTRINVKRSNELTSDQQKSLNKLSERYNNKFTSSKRFAQENRQQLADPRVVSGFRDNLKEIIFPIVVERSEGPYLWDIDGNKFVDVTCGFGSNFFGNGADFIRDAIIDQLNTGYEIGPQTPLAAEVSKKFCQVTDSERVAFCNTGSEAVLGAMRLARTVTGKDNIVMFENDYHGIVDEVIVHRGSNGLPLAAAAGIPEAAVSNTMILDYGNHESLAYIKKNADDIAALLIEPVQSRNPELQPREFVSELRKICDENDIALIFDEVITGFRLGPQGAQGHYGVKADIATYGKIIGGGMPIGVIAGKAEYMDALDGGQWQYGDDSSPEVGVTYFAGTFVRHPPAMAAANAVLDKLIAEPNIQNELGAKTKAMVEQMNAYAQEKQAPVNVVNCQSLFRLKIPQDIAYEELIYTILREKGVHVWDARPCFLTVSHSDEDIAYIISAFKEAIDEMLDYGFFPLIDATANDTRRDASAAVSTSGTSTTPPIPGARLGKDPQGKPAWFIKDPEQPGKYKMLEQD